jgi:hypothetical protein
VDIAFPIILVLGVLLLVLLAKTVRVVPQASVYVIERLGKYSRTLDPGIHILVPVLDRVRVKTDIREQVVGFPPQAVITKDNLVVGIDSVIYYVVTDPPAAEYKIENVVTAIEQLVVTTLRNVVGGMALEDALTGRDHINERLATCSTRRPASGASRSTGSRSAASSRRPPSATRWSRPCAPTAASGPRSSPPRAGSSRRSCRPRGRSSRSC